MHTTGDPFPTQKNLIKGTSCIQQNCTTRPGHRWGKLIYIILLLTIYLVSSTSLN